MAHVYFSRPEKCPFRTTLAAVATAVRWRCSTNLGLHCRSQEGDRFQPRHISPVPALGSQQLPYSTVAINCRTNAERANVNTHESLGESLVNLLFLDLEAFEVAVGNPNSSVSAPSECLRIDYAQMLKRQSVALSQWLQDTYSSIEPPTTMHDVYPICCGIFSFFN